MVKIYPADPSIPSETPSINYHGLYHKEDTDNCIWFDTDHYWRMGKCENIGEPIGYAYLNYTDIWCPVGGASVWNKGNGSTEISQILPIGGNKGN